MAPQGKEKEKHKVPISIVSKYASVEHQFIGWLEIIIQTVHEKLTTSSLESCIQIGLKKIFGFPSHVPLGSEKQLLALLDVERE